ncbi:galactoside 2-alpha-L-fucosyltransferase-like [Corylus avellana]|uniref:galactoside 2-alpha-L-fucosyltransferase-like n=1 Tax=Corylus avellana TaxID=13451 RepID=UPI00286A1A63|nr:galactoside 2-alpha-L-fucosyltransferase-like [Corylus avellana]
MDLKALRRQSSPSKPAGLPRTLRAARVAFTKSGFTTMKLLKILAASLVALPVLVTLMLILRNPPADRIAGLAEARALERVAHNGTSLGFGSADVSSQPTDTLQDKLLDGLLAPGFDEESCLSRYQSSLYRKNPLHKPSSYLLSRLRSYEDLHKRCGPYTKSYNRTLEQLKSGHNASSTECKYLVWISFSGLGNRILTLASAFLYAILTNRVLLVDPGKDMADLFCEPFPEKSWLLPTDFSLKDQFNTFDQKSHYSYGNMLKNNILNSSTETLPSHLYLYLAHDYDDQDKLFFCDQDQALLRRVPWLVMKTDNYFVPSLFLIPSFEQELSKLFPQKEAVFHHLGRYLFHPSNHVWGLITRYYQAYLANADERIGIQIRVFDTGSGPSQYVMDQILACTLKEKVLPEVDRSRPIVSPLGKRNLKAVLITSLSSGYFENVRNMYWEHPTVTGEVVGVYQPSHEEFQQTQKHLHNRKAWAEMYLLSLTDVLVTSAWSTFGYVAQGLGGLKPWLLYKPENQTAPDPACRQLMSMEPCFHAPPFYDCKAKTGIDTGTLVPHVRHCEDMSWGLKLVDGHNEL